MPAEAAIQKLIHLAAAGVQAWARKHPMAPTIRSLRLIVDRDVTICMPGDEGLRHAEFLDEHLGSSRVRPSFEAAGEALRRALPAGAFPFQIDIEIELTLGDGRTLARAEAVSLSAAGVKLYWGATWDRHIHDYADRLWALSKLAAETMDKSVWFSVREPAGEDDLASATRIFASTEAAAQLKAIWAEDPMAAKRIIAGQGFALHQHQLQRLARIRVCPAGPSLTDMVRAFTDKATSLEAEGSTLDLA